VCESRSLCGAFWMRRVVPQLLHARCVDSRALLGSRGVFDVPIAPCSDRFCTSRYDAYARIITRHIAGLGHAERSKNASIRDVRKNAVDWLWDVDHVPLSGDDTLLWQLDIKDMVLSILEDISGFTQGWGTLVEVG